MSLFPLNKQATLRHMGRSAQLAGDAFIAAASFIAAHLLRFDGWPPVADSHRMFLLLPYIVSGRLAMNWMSGVYRRIWRYVNVLDAVLLVRAAASLSAVLLLLRAVFAWHPIRLVYLTVPIGTILIDFVLVTGGMIGLRVLRRMQFETEVRASSPAAHSSRRVLLVGAGNAGIMAVKEITSRPDLGLNPVGFVDDDSSKWSTILFNVPVLGATNDLPRLVAKLDVDLVIITMASAPRQTITRIVNLCEAVSVPVQIIPGLYEILSSQVSVSRMRAVEIEDLLGRNPINVAEWRRDTEHIYCGKTILVTGAGGSIGSELCRQLTVLKPSSLILLDKDEFGVFEIERELRPQCSANAVQLIPVICDIRQESQLWQIFLRYSPDVVFHAAAHKHVPLMEANPSEAVRNNVGGAISLLNCCERCAPERVVFVSTDKAVNPTNVMGATKRVTELLLQARARSGRTPVRYAGVRFGNVLGSRGSVVPVFREQIRAGGPVTVTHPDMVRYFMTIPEAAQLIIEAGSIGTNGQLFLLDMGEPVRVLDMARDMIRLSGFEPGKDIPILFTGLRPGEKLREELLIEAEGVEMTKYERIFVAPALDVNIEQFQESVTQLMELARLSQDQDVVRNLAGMNLGYHPAPSAQAANVS